jgi:CubicO group peptidase (beta-lactamase class C family)
MGCENDLQLLKLSHNVKKDGQARPFFCLLFLNPKIQIVSASWLKKMVEDSVIPEWFYVQATGKSVSNSYGHHIYGGLPNSPEVFWIEGMGLQLVMINPQTQTVIVRLGGIPSALNVFSNRHDDSVIAPLLNVLMADI